MFENEKELFDHIPNPAGVYMYWYISLIRKKFTKSIKY